MAIFQLSILKQQKQDEALVASRWAEFQNYLSKVDAIKDFKEEEYQEGFLKDVFESSLGYTLKTTNPDNNNLEREKKNETNSKKADGVIKVDDTVVGVIELKAQDTKNLDKVESQAFEYHNEHSNSKYIIISNFDELRFYVDKKTAYEKFSLFKLDYEEFKKLHLLLSYESIKEDIPLKLKEKSNNFETQISKELYKDFSAFRMHLFENLVKNNTQDKSELLRLTQKLCDRIIFILFAEDRGLLKLNTIKEIREEFKSQKFTSYSLYDIYKFYFDAINEGNEKLGIPKYNGGLFASDAVLDALNIDDEVLDMEAQKLSDYDFASEVGVNILGHIFEQSLTDLEEMQANIEHTEFDKTKSKRKKDGVFYTPEYITKYIVDNTLGKMCEEKREEFGIGSETLVSPKNPKKPTKKELKIKENLQHYKEWLLNIKILDPACGSGAFLNQALEFLIEEHKRLQNDLALMGDLFASYQVEESVLENNLYGVDINEDATEIAKLSLWLRTAKKGRCLTKLADKILCANSLLDMPFDEGSFDVVIGNPPYVRHEAIKYLKDELKEKYEVFSGTADLYVYFYELGIKMLKQNGLIGYICSNKFFRAKYGEKLREYILRNITIEQIADFNGVKVFEDATVDSTMTIFKKDVPKNNNNFKVVDMDLINSYEMNQNDLLKSSFTFLSITELNIKKKIEFVGIKLKEWNLNIYRGVSTGCNDAFIINKDKKDELIAKNSKYKNIIKPILRGRVLKRFQSEFTDEYLIYIPWSFNIEDNMEIKQHLELYKDKLSIRPEVQANRYAWYAMSRFGSAYHSSFNNNKIIYPEFSSSPLFSYDDKKSYLLDTSWFIDKDDKFLLACLNSKLTWYYLQFISSTLGQNSLRMKKIFIEQLPIPIIDKEAQQPFIDLVDNILDSKEKVKKYKKYYESLNAVDKIEITEEIEKLEIGVEEDIKKIDVMVYKLYDLTDEEIKIVEGV